MQKLLFSLLILFSLQQVHAMENSSSPISQHQYARIINAAFSPTTLQQLIKEGFEVNSKIDQGGNTALMKIACREGKFCLDKEDNLNACNNLIAQGADVNLKNDNGSTALRMAVICGNTAVCKILLDAGAHVHEQDDSVDSPLLLAAQRSHYEICKMLIEHGADLDAQNKEYGATPLMFLCTSENLWQLLIDRGANIYLKDNRGRTVFSDPRIVQVRSLAECIIIRSHISPVCTQEQLQHSQQRTRARLAALKDTPLPKVLYELILSSNPEVWKDACNTPLGMHRGRYDRVHLLPLQITRYLIKQGALHHEKTVTALKAYKIAKLKSYLEEALQAALSYPFPAFSEFYTVFNINLLEQNCGQEIENVMAERLRDNA